MITYIFRSPKKDEMYLYLLDKNGFTELDQQLQKTFGPAEFVMMVNLAKRDKLARADIDKVKQALSEQGFYLQMPPKPEQLAKDFNDSK